MNKLNESAATAPRSSGVAVATSLPNLLTYARIAAVPALVACFFLLRGDWAFWTALAIFVAASITDFFDGYLARAWHQQSRLGRMLDPIADKLLVATSVLMLVSVGIIGGWSIWAARRSRQAATARATPRALPRSSSSLASATDSRSAAGAGSFISSSVPSARSRSATCDVP